MVTSRRPVSPSTTPRRAGPLPRSPPGSGGGDVNTDPDRPSLLGHHGRPALPGGGMSHQAELPADVDAERERTPRPFRAGSSEHERTTAVPPGRYMLRPAHHLAGTGEPVRRTTHKAEGAGRSVQRAGPRVSSEGTGGTPGTHACGDWTSTAAEAVASPVVEAGRRPPPSVAGGVRRAAMETDER